MNGQETESTLAMGMNRVCHELRRPITLIHSFSELLCEGLHGPLNADQHECAERILDSSRKLDSIVRGLYDLAEIEGGAPQLSRENCDVGRIYDDVEQEFGRLFAEAGIGIEFVRRGELTDLHVDAGRLRRTVAYLLDNVLRFVPRGGRARVSLEHTAHTLHIEVSDDGPGVPDQDLERVFAPFQRAENRDTDVGIGVGLAVCRTYAEAHCGRAFAERSAQGGLRVLCELNTAAPSSTPAS
ncbi:MAG: HAMP domain-containing histidine kinase [bacterium]|nr:HAMP domain-containing histidine kinase [bacterium]